MSGQIALVTGASEGIGLECARVLAGKDFDLVLVARREQLLQEVAERLRRAHAIECTVIPFDLAQADSAGRLFAEVKQRGLEVDVLVNNAGLLCNGWFTDLELEAQQQLLTLNMLTLTGLCHLFARDMAQRGGGRILNISSVAAWTPIPKQNVYAASKAYVLSFSLALADELRATGSGVRVTACCPGYTATRMLDNPQQGEKLSIPASMILSAHDVAERAVTACLAGRTLVVPGVSNRLLTVLLQLLPKTLRARLAGSLYRRYMH